MFEHADAEVERIGKSSRKVWQADYHDAVMMKVAYGFALRFNELRHLQTVDFARNRAIGELVLEVPPSLVADALGCSTQVAFLHDYKAAEPWARYAGRSLKPL